MTSSPVALIPTNLYLGLEGVFNETFELDDFPVDRQGLTLMVNFNCRIGGPLPVEIVIDNECRITLSCITTCHPAKEWKVAPQLSIRTLRLGEEYSMDRVFPAICLKAVPVEDATLVCGGWSVSWVCITLQVAGLPLQLLASIDGIIRIAVAAIGAPGGGAAAFPILLVLHHLLHLFQVRPSGAFVFVLFS